MLTGAYTIYQGREVKNQAKGPRRLRTHSLVITALALSIDNLAVGFALAVYHIQIVLAAVTMGVISVLMSLLGLELGHRLGRRVGEWGEGLGGGLLIPGGLALAPGTFR